ncbi:hypothetical protein [Nonomuraea sp. NPDC049400]|uniref:hypothetical protein n=1 Tax=Nonomuraea sp. NPDC049400 TaxID=3364352 RepID=UPI0037B62B4C
MLDDALNAAGFADAPCVRYYRTIRNGVGTTAEQLGYGVNKRPPAAAVRTCLTRIFTDVVERRSLEYDDSREQLVRELVGLLLARYLALPAIDAAQIVLFHGTTEAISVASDYASRRKLQPVLPLPNYFAFEHSLARHGAGNPQFYSATGRTTAAPAGQRPRLLVDVAPNGVLGTVFERPPHRTGDLCLLDIPFSLPQFVPPGSLRRTLRERLVGERWMLCMTPSKDLSMPGLRVGFIATSDPDFVQFAAADRFERGYTVHAATGMIAALHLGLLLLASGDGAEIPRLTRRLAADFHRHSVPFLSTDEITCFRRELSAARDAFRRNLDVIEHEGLFEISPETGPPVAGYSTFRWLRADFPSSAAYTRWVNELGRAGLKVNPNLLFSGDEAAWADLYPDRYGIRLNLSVPMSELQPNLRSLAVAMKEATR